MKTDIILNPDVEIVNEDDRKLYWQFRLALDSKFLQVMRNHLDEGEHCYHACMNQYLDVRQLSLKQFVDQHSQQHPIQEIFDELGQKVGEELTESVANMIALLREARRRGIRFK